MLSNPYPSSSTSLRTIPHVTNQYNNIFFSKLQKNIHISTRIIENEPLAIDIDVMYRPAKQSIVIDGAAPMDGRRSGFLRIYSSDFTHSLTLSSLRLPVKQMPSCHCPLPPAISESNLPLLPRICADALYFPRRQDGSFFAKWLCCKNFDTPHGSCRGACWLDCRSVSSRPYFPRGQN